MEVLRLWSKSRVAQLDFLVTSGNRGIFDDEAGRLGARIHYLPFERRALFSFARGIRRILKNERYQAIHDHQDYASGWHFLMGLGLLPPFRITHVHNSAYQIRNNYGITPARRVTASVGKQLVAHFATHITGTSRSVISEYGFKSAQFAGIQRGALYCGFDPSRFTVDRGESRRSVLMEFGWPEDAKIILFVGRLDESPDFGHKKTEKNSGFAVSVGIECCRLAPQIRMLMVGAQNNSIISLKARVLAADLNGRIRFEDIRFDVGRLMAASDILLFPSRREGLGMVAVEAQAAGLPVLASTGVPTECRVVPELVEFREIGDGVGVWAASILKILAKPRSITNAGQQVRASKFSIENSAAALLSLYSFGRLL